MKKFKFVILFLMVIFVSGQVSDAATNVSACGTISSAGEYALNTSIINSAATTCINITTSNVVFDGQNYTIDGIDALNTYGVYVYNSSLALTNVTAKNVVATDWNNGVYYYNASNGSIENNNLSSNSYGILLNSSSNNTISNNTANSNSNYGIYLESSSSNNSISNNNASSNSYGILLTSSSNNTLSNNNANSNNQDGISIRVSSNNNTINNNNVTLNTYGIYLQTSNNNTLTNNNVSNNAQCCWTGIGILLSSSNNNTVSNNTANSNSNYGIDLSSSSNDNILNGNIVRLNTEQGIGLITSIRNTLTNNNASDNIINGIYLSGSSNNTLTNNNANSNSNAGISLESSNSNNSISNNNATSNTYGIYLSTSSKNIIHNNNATLNSHTGIYLFSSSNNNTINNNNATSNSQYGFIIQSSSNNNTLANNIANSNTGNTGIYLESSSSNNLTNNSATSNSYGIYLSTSSNNNILTSNTANSNTNYGITLSSSSNNNTLTSNTANLNNYGLTLAASSNNNTIRNNTANSNSNTGIRLFSSNNNTIYNNSFNNTNNSGFSGTANNFWNITKTAGTSIVGGPYLGGNFWAHPNGTGFSKTCTDADGDGLCDANYTLASGNIDYLPLSLNFTSDTTPPASITSLMNASYASNYINWTWTDPTDIDFANVSIYLNGTFMTNVSAGVQYYNASGLSSDTAYNISTRTVDVTGNINQTWKNNTARTAPAAADSTPPASITSLTNISYASNYINWTWTDPVDSDFSNVSIYLNGTFMTNVSAGVQYYNATGLSSDTAYNISTRTVDLTGNINQTWKNNTARTAPASSSPTPTPAPSSPSSGGSSGSGSSSVASSEPSSNINRATVISKDIHANTEVTYSIPQDKGGISEIGINGKENVNEVVVRVEQLKELSKQLKEPAPGDVYYYVNINVGTKKINDATIKFRVENKWLEDMKLDDSDVKLVKWDGKKWKKLENKTESGYYLSLNVVPNSPGVLAAEGNYKFNLDIYSSDMGGAHIEDGYKLSLVPTQTPQSYSFDATVTGKNETYTFYEATTESFSTFAITGIKSVSADTAMTVGLSGVTAKVTAIPEVAQTTPEKASPAGLVIIFVVFVLTAIAVTLYIKKKQK